ncbi:cupin [Salmonella enterica subsp. enterica serovar Choleraesuis]|nr:cupin [Salmonella enterica subsp. enterica serovar Choleraesuis]
MKRPDCIRHWRDIEGPDDSQYPDSQEKFSIGAPLARAFGLNRLGIHHERLLPGRRTSYPHAESLEEEFVYVISGYPHAWINGYLYPLQPGDSVGLRPGTGLCHTIINNSDEEVELLVIGEPNRADNKIYYPKNPRYAASRPDRWIDHPPQFFGPHDGKPDPK